MKLRDVALTLVLAFSAAAAESFPDTPLATFEHEGWRISTAMTVSQVEASSLENVKEKGQRVPQVPFGFLNAQWKVFKTQVRVGDSLVRLTSPPETWQQLMGWDGYAIVRSGVVVARFTVAVN